VATLRARERKALPNSAFAGGVDKTKGSGDARRRRFPVHDKAHARAALRLLGRAKGLSAEAKARIKSRARAKLAGG
jgi:hypothetical protein